LLKGCDSMGDYAIEIKNLCKSFDKWRNTFYGGLIKDGKSIIFDNLSLTLKQGQIIGIIGNNGSGKSTLLKIISGILHQDSGKITLHGRVGCILELGLGFDSESSGRINIESKCKMYGLSEDQIKNRSESIIKFSELGERIDEPLRTYSSGMVAKLALAIIIHTDCEILVLDEVLSVGDESFNLKCKNKFSELKKIGRTILIASHNLKTIERMCDITVWMESGSVKKIGNTTAICHEFYRDSIESPSTLKYLSDLGDPNAMNKLAELYRDGYSVVKNLDLSKKLFAESAERGNIEALVNLGDILMQQKDTARAKDLFAKAAQSGNLDAINRLYLNGNNSITNIFDTIKQEYDSGNSQTIRLLAELYDQGIGVPRDTTKAVELYTEAVENGDLVAAYVLGLKYRDGKGVKKNLSAAIDLLTMVCRHGNNRACLDLAKLFMYNTEIDDNYAKALEVLKIGASRGDTNAIIQISNMYRDGNGIVQDAAASEIWQSLFADKTRVTYECAIADILFNQKNNNAGLSIAFELYLDAAKCGHIGAQYTVALCYRDGIGTEPDFERAIDWFSVAAESKNVKAILELANIYLKGWGVPKSTSKAAELYEEAAKLGNANARYQIGIMYRDGLGVDVNLDLAKHYLKLSCEQGNLNATLAITEIETVNQKNNTVTR